MMHRISDQSQRSESRSDTISRSESEIEELGIELQREESKEKKTSKYYFH